AVDPVLDELRFDQRQGQRRGVDVPANEPGDVRHGPDMVFVTVRQHEPGDTVLMFQIAQIRNDSIDAEQLRVREHHAGVDNDRRVVASQRHHVHAELAESAERHHFEHAEISSTTATGHVPGGTCSLSDESRNLATRSGSWERLKFAGGLEISPYDDPDAITQNAMDERDSRKTIAQVVGSDPRFGQTGSPAWQTRRWPAFRAVVCRRSAPARG